MQAGDVWLNFLNMNPPHFHLLLWPIAALPLATAVYVWMVANLAAGFVSAVVVWSEIGMRARWHHLLPGSAAVLACGATGALCVTGQFSGLLLLPLVLAWRSARQGQAIAAGLWLGVVISIKPFLGLFLPILLVRWEWRAALAGVGSCLACFAVGGAVFGVQAHAEWAAALADVKWVWGAMNGSWQAVLTRCLAPSPYAMPLVNAPGVIRPLWLFGAAIVGVITLSVSRRSVDHAFAAAVLGALLISPLGWVYYVWLALPGTVALWRNRVPRVARPGLIALVVPYFCPALAGQFGPVLTLSIGSIYTWAIFALWSGVVMVQDAEVAAGPLGANR